MSPLEIAAVTLGSVAIRLLAFDGGFARQRMAALLARPAPPRGQQRRWPVPMARSILVGVPALTTALFVGPVLGLAVGAVLGSALYWRLHQRGSHAAGSTRVSAGLPIAIDLMAAGVRSGGTMTSVLAAVTPTLGGSLGTALEGVADRLHLGADSTAAWGTTNTPPELAALGRALARANETGAPVADVLERQAADTRQRLRTHAFSAAQRLGVLVVAPLGLCFLPAFVLIGIVPLAAGLISGLDLP